MPYLDPVEAGNFIAADNEPVVWVRVCGAQTDGTPLEALVAVADPPVEPIWGMAAAEALANQEGSLNVMLIRQSPGRFVYRIVGSDDDAEESEGSRPSCPDECDALIYEGRHEIVQDTLMTIAFARWPEWAIRWTKTVAFA